MNGSKKIAIVFPITLLVFLLGACGILPTARINDATVTSAPTLTPVPVTFTLTSTPEVVYVTDIPTPIPTPQPLPIFTPDAIQVERWQEYQTELAKLVLSQAGDVFPFYEQSICEWDILGRSRQEVYVWAQCSGPGTGGIGPAVIYLNIDGSIGDVTYAFPGYGRDSVIRRLFPVEVQEKIDLYFSDWSSHSGRVNELRLHLLYRDTHPDVPPLIVFSATLPATSIP